MRFVIQRVTEATCEVDQKITGQITNGFCVLIGIAETDTKNIADKMIRKLLGMRIFGDENGKTNLSLHDIEGSLLLISQFTLYADCRKGNRPSFIKAGNGLQRHTRSDILILSGELFVKLRFCE